MICLNKMRFADLILFAFNKILFYNKTKEIYYDNHHIWKTMHGQEHNG